MVAQQTLFGMVNNKADKCVTSDNDVLNAGKHIM
jgi:hypothetical protein